MAPDQRKIRVAIIGAGISGLAQAIRLQDALGERVVITVVEKGSSPGGVWRDSTWPGAGVDIPIHLYSLYSDPKHDWESVYASQEQVLEYWEGLIERHRLRNILLLNTEWKSSQWSNSSQTHTSKLWNSATKEFSTMETEILISANGPLSTPLIPDIPGLDTYKGVQFHNLRWDKNVDFRNKRVAVIGNGSSAVQLIPGLAEISGTCVTQFIRSGGYYFPKPNPRFTKWELFCFKWVPGLLLYKRARLFLDHNTRWKVRNSDSRDDHTMLEKSLLSYLEETAPAEYLEALRPTYPLGCKRPAFDAGWLKSLHRSNVHLTNSSITNITASGIRTIDGLEIKADIIVFATGSDVAEHGLGLNIGLHGEDGLELRTYWKSIAGPQSYLGLSVPKFPNYFMVVGPNAIAGSWGYTIGNQTSVIARMIKEIYSYNLRSIQPREDVFHRHNLALQQQLSSSTMASDKCTSWWRITGGRISVPNSLSAIGLWRATRTTRWADWKAVRLAEDGTPKTVDMVAEIQRRTVRWLALWALLTVLGGYAACSDILRSILPYF